jgi:hypothetical protein
MQAYQNSFNNGQTRALISPKSDFFRYFSTPRRRRKPRRRSLPRPSPRPRRRKRTEMRDFGAAIGLVFAIEGLLIAEQGLWRKAKWLSRREFDVVGLDRPVGLQFANPRSAVSAICAFETWGDVACRREADITFAAVNVVVGRTPVLPAGATVGPLSARKGKFPRRLLGRYRTRAASRRTVLRRLVLAKILRKRCGGATRRPSKSNRRSRRQASARPNGRGKEQAAS